MEFSFTGMFQLLFRPLELCISKLWHTHTHMLYKPQFKCLSISKLWYTLTYMLYEPQFKCLSLFSHFSNFVMFPIFEVTVDKIQLASPCFLCKTVIYKVNNTILRFNFSKQILLSMTKLPIDPHLKPLCLSLIHI